MKNSKRSRETVCLSLKQGFDILFFHIAIAKNFYEKIDTTLIAVLSHVISCLLKMKNSWPGALNSWSYR